jgi:hypothetical protein
LSTRSEISIVNACFVSYSRSENQFYTETVKSFLEVLEGQISLFIPKAKIYWDKRLEYGDIFDPELATQLCHSACMIMLYNPFYFDLECPFCAREYQAMVRLEQMRFDVTPAALKNRGLIIPVVIRGEDSLPREIKSLRNYVTFDRDLLQPTDFEKRSLRKKIREIAEVVYERYETHRRLAPNWITHFDQFQFPSADEIRPWLEQVVAAKPEQSPPGLEGAT